MPVSSSSLAIGGTGGGTALILRKLWELLTVPVLTGIDPSLPPTDFAPILPTVRFSEIYLPWLGQTVIVEERWAFFLSGVVVGLFLIPILEIGAVLRRRWLLWLRHWCGGASFAQDRVIPLSLRGKY